MAAAAILRNHHILATVQAISMKFGTVTHFYLLDRADW